MKSLSVRLLTAFAFLVALMASASADVRLRVSSTKAMPGDPVLVTVTGSSTLPKGTADGKALEFFRAKSGYQALFAVPLDHAPDTLSVEVDSAKLPVSIAIGTALWPRTDIIVEDEFANPPAADRERITADNKAIIGAMTGKSEPQFTRAFRRPRGEVTSRFGEWRTFNDGHSSQHLGVDLFAKEGARVNAINAGTVTLVRDTFLAGNVVVIAHGAGIASAYFHLSTATVAEGDVVAAGDPIGNAGHTGRTTGPHLHLAVRTPGGFVDPIKFFKLPISPALPATARR
jgi:murein DD-endopeptidase MepM/ murein hydrolase activator NlpD